MNKLNNKGQSLVLFVCLLPMIIFVVAVVIDIGYMANEKKKVDNINLLAVKYAKKNIDEEEINSKIINLIQKNDSKIENIEISKNEETIAITIKKTVPSIMGKIIKINTYDIVSVYQYNEKIKRIK